MVLPLIIVLVLCTVAPIIGVIIGLISALFGKDTGAKGGGTSNGYRHYVDYYNHPGLDYDNDSHKPTSSNYDPFDNHWESSFDWKDENNDGYDDRDDGFWNEREY